MPDTATAVVEITSEVVSAYLARHHVPRAEIPVLIAAVHSAFTSLGSAPEPVVGLVKPVPAVPVRKSVTDDYIVCLEDGKKFKSLKVHLAKLGMTPEQYRAKWRLPSDYPMICASFARQRRELANSIGLGFIRRKG